MKPLDFLKGALFMLGFLAAGAMMFIFYVLVGSFLF